MRIAVLSTPGSWYFKDLTRAADRCLQLTPITFRDLSSRLGQTSEQIRSQSCLSEFSAVIVRTMPPGSLEQVVFRMDALARYESTGGVVVNSSRAIETAVDKYLASAKLQAAGLLVPRTIVCQTSEEAMAAFQELGGDVVLKPLFGSEGRGIARLTDEALALRAFKMLESMGAVLYLQEFISHEGHDVRVMVIGDRVLGMTRRNALDWRTNVSRGASAEALKVSDSLGELAKRAALAVGADIAGVDFLPSREGSLYAIEVNAVPGWRALASATGEDVGRMVVGRVAQLVRDGKVS